MFARKSRDANCFDEGLRRKHGMFVASPVVRRWGRIHPEAGGDWRNIVPVNAEFDYLMRGGKLIGVTRHTWGRAWALLVRWRRMRERAKARARNRRWRLKRIRYEYKEATDGTDDTTDQ